VKNILAYLGILVLATLIALTSIMFMEVIIDIFSSIKNIKTWIEAFGSLVIGIGLIKWIQWSIIYLGRKKSSTE